MTKLVSPAGTVANIGNSELVAKMLHQGWTKDGSPAPKTVARGANRRGKKNDLTEEGTEAPVEEEVEAEVEDTE